MDDLLWGVISLVAYIGCPCLLLYWMRTLPRNKGELHGGGFEGSGAAFGYPPLKDRSNNPRKRVPFPLTSDAKTQNDPLP